MTIWWLFCMNYWTSHDISANQSWFIVTTLHWNFLNEFYYNFEVISMKNDWFSDEADLVPSKAGRACKETSIWSKIIAPWKHNQYSIHNAYMDHLLVKLCNIISGKHSTKIFSNHQLTTHIIQCLVLQSLGHSQINLKTYLFYPPSRTTHNPYTRTRIRTLQFSSQTQQDLKKKIISVLVKH